MLLFRLNATHYSFPFGCIFLAKDAIVFFDVALA